MEKPANAVVIVLALVTMETVARMDYRVLLRNILTKPIRNISSVIVHVGNEIARTWGVPLALSAGTIQVVNVIVRKDSQVMIVPNYYNVYPGQMVPRRHKTARPRLKAAIITLLTV